MSPAYDFSSNSLKDAGQVFLSITPSSESIVNYKTRDWEIEIRLRTKSVCICHYDIPSAEFDKYLVDQFHR